MLSRLPPATKPPAVTMQERERGCSDCGNGQKAERKKRRLTEGAEECGNATKQRLPGKRTLGHVVDRFVAREECFAFPQTKFPMRNLRLRFQRARDALFRGGSMQFSFHSPVSRISCCTAGTPVSFRCISPTSISIASPPTLAGS